METSELRVIPNESGASTPAPDLSNLSDAQLIEQMKVAEQAVESEKQKANEIAVEDSQKAPVAPVQTGQAPTATGQENQVSPTEPIKPTPTAQELMEKKGWKSFDDVVKGYTNLEREATRMWQEKSRASRGEVTTPAPSINPQDINASVIENINTNPIDTIGILAEQRLAPKIAELEERQREILRHNAIESLASNPRTADFNNPIMQERMMQIFRENPDWALDTRRHLINVYKIAKSDLSDQAQLNAFQAGKENGQQKAQEKQLASVESAGRPPVNARSSSIYDAPVEDLDAAIRAMLAKNG